MWRTEQGFSLVEVLVAVLLLTGGALGTATVLHRATGALWGARRHELMLEAGLDKLSQLSALAWEFEEVTPMVFSAQQDTSTALSAEELGAGGSGIGARSGVDHVGGAGGWAGGDRPQLDAVLERRWTISPHPTLADVLVLSVHVVPHLLTVGARAAWMPARQDVFALRVRSVR